MEQTHIGIIGAGCSGLFAAMVLEYLRSQIEGLALTYEIMEANGQERVGGRLYTYKFSDNDHDYIDLGAMRFPENQYMSRTFQLFKYLAPEVELHPYFMDNKQDTGRTSRCGIHEPKLMPEALSRDQVAELLVRHAKIPKNIVRQHANFILEQVFATPIGAARRRLLSGEWKNPRFDPDFLKDECLKLLEPTSIREFLMSEQNPYGPFDTSTVQSLEDSSSFTNAFNGSALEAVLESIYFESGNGWYGIKKGAQQIAKGMANRLSRLPRFGHEVKAVKKSSQGVLLDIKCSDGNKLRREEKRFDAVICSTTLVALQRLDLDPAVLKPETLQAIGTLSYAPCCKVAIKFRKAWWRLPPFGVLGGGQAHTDLPLRLCVYPSHSQDRDPSEAAVLLCSYTWADDAQRMSTLLYRNDDTIKDILLHNLSVLHSNNRICYNDVFRILAETYDSHIVFEWKSDPFTGAGAAYFQPGQFSGTLPALWHDNDGFFLIGEATSLQHAWVEGSLDSALAGVHQMLSWFARQFPGERRYKEALQLLCSQDCEALFKIAGKKQTSANRMQHNKRTKESFARSTCSINARVGNDG